MGTRRSQTPTLTYTDRGDQIVQMSSEQDDDDDDDDDDDATRERIRGRAGKQSTK